MSWGKNLYDLVRIPVRKACDGYYIRWFYNGWHYWFFIPGQYYMNTQGEKYRTIGSRTVRISTGQITRNQEMAIRTILNTREASLWTVAGWMNIRIEPSTVEIFDNQISGGEQEYQMIIGSKEITYTDGYSPVLPVPIIPATVSYCEVTIGGQTWMCINFDSNYPGSKVYYNDENNRLGLGGLYTYNQIMSAGFCPDGWHVPSLVEWLTLTNYVGGDVVAGGMLKEAGVSHWNAPNTGATDTVGFSARGGGYFDPQYYNMFFGFYETAIFWTATGFPSTDYAYCVIMNYLDATITYTTYRKDWLFSVRLIKNIPSPQTEILIGTQVWKIRNVDDNIPGSRVYNDDENNRAIYGGLYDWSMVAAVEAANPGYHVPTSTEFATLVAFLGGAVIAGGFLKEAGLTHWNAPNTGGDNSSGFTALGAGGYFLIYDWLGQYGIFWTNTEIDAFTADTMVLENNTEASVIGPAIKTGFYSIRLIKD